MTHTEAVLGDLAAGRASPAGFARRASEGRWRLAPHLAVLNYYLLMVYAGQIKRLMVWMPPRHGKSELVSHYFPAFWLGHRPHDRVLLASYEAEFAAHWGRLARDTLTQWGPETFGVTVATDSRATNRWDIQGTRGGMFTAGVGGSITGRGGHLLDLDDPIKNDEQANSSTYQNKSWEWWKATWRTRAQKNAAMVHVQTRWNQNDLGGRILEHDNAGEWTVLNLPAIAELPEDDVLGWHRDPGDALWPEMYDLESLESLKTDVGGYWWSALYQQRPQPLGGGIFKKDFFRYWHGGTEGVYTLLTPTGPKTVLQVKCRRFLTVDPAASTRETADYTVVAAWAVTPDNDLILLDLARTRMEGPDQPGMIRMMADRWKVATIKVESVAYQLSLIQTLRRAGLPITKLVADKDKVSRALTAAAMVEGGSVYFPANASWLDDYEDELLVFPNGAHDDQVDVTSYAAREIVQKERLGPQIMSW